MAKSIKILYILILIASTLALSSCVKDSDIRQERQVMDLLEDAEKMTSMSRYEEAVNLAFEALRLSDSEDARDHALKGMANMTLSKLFLQTSRDSLAWEHACQAEKIAVQVKDDSLKAAALLQKGKVCSYSNLSVEDNRDDEGVGYLEEALRLSEAGGWKAVAAESCYFLCEILVNKNRWNDRLDRDIYDKAGEWLEKAEELDENKPSARSLSTRMRYLRQGQRTDEAIDYCVRALDGTPENDYLKRYQLYDHLTVLYLQKGNSVKGMEAHQNYSYCMQMYMRQKGDDILQEQETKYRTELKDRQIKSRTFLAFLLGILLVLSLLVTTQYIRLTRQIRKQNKSIQAISRSREMLFAVIAKDLYDPSVAGVGDSQILDFVRKWPLMDEDEIKKQCERLSEGDDPLDPVVAKYISDLMLARRKSLGDKGLSPREIEIITLSKEGLSDKQIADRLCLSSRTVSNHKYRIYSKLGVSGNSEMLGKAEELGL